MSKFDLSPSEVLATGHSRRTFLRLSGTFGAALALTGAVGACSGPQSSTTVGQQPQGTAGASTFDVAIGYNNNSSWDPLNTGSAFAMAAHNHVYEPLWDATAGTREAFAALASELPSDPTSLEETVKLREGATWHDGKPVTADDVVYSFAR